MGAHRRSAYSGLVRSSQERAAQSDSVRTGTPTGAWGERCSGGAGGGIRAKTGWATETVLSVTRMHYGSENDPCQLGTNKFYQFPCPMYLFAPRGGGEFRSRV